MDSISWLLSLINSFHIVIFQASAVTVSLVFHFDVLLLRLHHFGDGHPLSPKADFRQHSPVNGRRSRDMVTASRSSSGVLRIRAR